MKRRDITDQIEDTDAASHISKKKKTTSASEKVAGSLHSPTGTKSTMHPASQPEQVVLESGYASKISSTTLPEQKLSSNNNSSSDATSGSEKTRGGRRGDPRMHKAVEARLADPSISLLGALLKGGFKFPGYSNDETTLNSQVSTSKPARARTRKSHA